MSEHKPDSQMVQTSITTTTTTNAINSTMPPCSTESRIVEDEVDHRVKAGAAALTEATRNHLETRTGALHLRDGPSHLAFDASILPSTVTSWPAQDNAVLLTTIGLGIDPFFGSTSNANNATVAAIKAVRDAMERTVLQFPSDNSNLRLHIQLGVPPRLPQQTEPMHVNVADITPLLPSFVPLLPIEVVVGGLLSKGDPFINSRPGTHAMTCTVVACISLRKIGSVTTNEVRQPDYVSIGPSVPAPVHLRLNQSCIPELKIAPARVEAISETPQPVHICAASMEAAEVLSGSLSKTRKATSPEPTTARKNIDVLAHISAELHEGEPMKHKRSNSQADQQDGVGNYNYKKLPPGMTSKKNKRLFVKHSYRDYSHELPLPDELDLVDPSSNNTRTVNAAFPLKLHETLSLIERDGNDNIIGWLPHGRSFKIHQQNEFVEMILPKYFVMTKKSSFLRQLNLYGFNRLSGAGPDQGSYYHEKFLRGMKFLCRRIHRQKVNGNGIRAAGNPEGEPNLSSMSSCPPEMPRRQLPLVQASIIRSPQNSPPFESFRENRSLTSQDATPGLHAVTNQIAKETLGTLEGDRIDEEQSSAGDSGVSEAIKSSTQPSLVSASFPLKLHCILDKLESEGSRDIISWLPHGRAFLVYSVDRLVDELMPQYFNQSKYSSFQRQLHMYHFQRITAGRDKGAYHHPSFLRGRSDLCLSMTRTRVNGKGTRRPGNPEGEPDFYGMEAMPPVLPGTAIVFPTEVSSDQTTTNQESKKRCRVSSCGSDSS